MQSHRKFIVTLESFNQSPARSGVSHFPVNVPSTPDKTRSASQADLISMPQSPLQHLLKLLKVMSDQERQSDGLSKHHTTSAPSLQSLGDGIRFLEKFKKRPTGPMARSTPHTSPNKNPPQLQNEYSKLPDRRLSFSMPDLHRISPIKENRDEGNATGPTGQPAPKKLRFK
uniref:DNA repair protein rhp26 n=1 Tax=Lygus hesperus TaxID=30085 RepID=A0A0A9WDQ3_LYGHE